MEWELIIFDCDGVLVDSEPIADRIFLKVLTSEGFPLPPEDSKEWFTGYSMQSCLETIENHFGRPVPEHVPQRYYDTLFAEFKRSLLPITGIKEALDAIPYPACVASSGAHEKMQISLGHTGLLERFTGRIFSATEVAHGKPYPDLFLHAAKQCGVLPERCAVIEDSIPGVQAGIAAGMRVFAYINPPDPHQAKEFSESGAVVFNDMNTLPTLLSAPDKR